METEEGALRVLAAIRDTGASVADRKALTVIILKRASDAARQILEDRVCVRFVGNQDQLGVGAGQLARV
jgi:hypothetical protein